MSDTVRLTIECLSVDGDGLAHRGGEAWFVRATAPGDVVEVVEEGVGGDPVGPRRGPGRGSRNVRHGRVLRLVEPSPQRVEPECPVAEACGGCDWMHVRPAVRLREKQRLVREALGADEDFCAEWLGSPERFRRVARFAVGRGRAGPVIGFRQERSRRVVGLRDCPVLEPELSEALGALARADRALAAWSTRDTGDLWVLSDGDRRIHLAEVQGEGASKGGAGEALAELREALPERLRPASATPSIEAADGGAPLRVPVAGFVQANRSVGLALARRVAEAAAAAPGRIAELYAGSGHLTVALLRGAGALEAVESDPEAAKALRENLASRGGEARAVRSEATAYLRRLHVGPGLVVADPPRAGLGPAADELARLQPPCVILVSCDLRALVRDRKALAAAGYAIEHVVLADMFPPTHHVEVVTRFVSR